MKQLPVVFLHSGDDVTISIYRRLDFRTKLSHLRYLTRILTGATTLFLLSLVHGQGMQGNVTVHGNAIISLTGHSVTLTWNASPGATSYNTYRGTVHGGPYTRIRAGIIITTYIDIQVAHGQTLYYVVTAVNGGVESGYSNEACVVVP